MSANDSENLRSIVSVHSAGPLFDYYASLAEEGLTEPEAAILRTYCPHRNIAICNVGCGAGRETFGYYRLGYRDVVGVDRTEAMLRVAHRAARKLNVPERFVLASGDTLPFPDGRFQLVTHLCGIYGVITPRSARRRFLEETRRVLARDGMVFVITNSIRHRWYHRLYIRAADLLHRFWNPYDLEPGDKLMRRRDRLGAPGGRTARAHWFEPEELRAEVEEVGFKTVYLGGTVSVLTDPRRSPASFANQGWLVLVAQRSG